MDFITSTIKGIFTSLDPTTTRTATPENSAIHTSPDPVGTVIKIALILRCRLPADLVPLIMDHAQLWVPIATATSRKRDVDRISQAQSPKLQVALTVPKHVSKDSIRRVRFTIVSRDQGWSDFTKDHGTYHGSWTWFEAGVRGLQRDSSDPEQSKLGVCDRAQLLMLSDVLCTHRNALDEEHRLQCQPQEQFYKYGAKRLTANVHAGRDFREHVVEWALDDVNDDIVRIVRELKKGCRVEVAAHARFPGWVNYVKSVKIEIEGLAVRKL